MAICYFGRAVDHDGEILENFVTKKRDEAAALRFMKKALKRHGSPQAITTDGLRSYKAAMTDLGISDKQPIGRWANNRDENSHLPFRRRERAMLRFRRMKTPAEVRLGPRQRPQSFQLGTPPRRSTNLQARPLGRPGRVAQPHGLSRDHQRTSSANRRLVRIILTAPPRARAVGWTPVALERIPTLHQVRR